MSFRRVLELHARLRVRVWLLQLRKAFKTMRGGGGNLQLSVLRCEPSAEEDQVLFVNEEPADGRRTLASFTTRRSKASPTRMAIVV